MGGHHAARLESRVETFNSGHSVGTMVDLRKDNGETFRTRTRSRASVLSGHSAVIWLEGITGGYMLERVKPLRPSRTQALLLAELSDPGARLRRTPQGWFVGGMVAFHTATIDACLSAGWIEKADVTSSTYAITRHGLEAIDRC